MEKESKEKIKKLKICVDKGVYLLYICIYTVDAHLIELEEK